jgi:hypothetical protein
MDNSLLAVMTVAELRKFREGFKDNESLVKLIDGFIEVKTAEDRAKAEALQFNSKVAKAVNTLPVPPQGVFNIFLSYRDIEIEDKTGKPEAVEVIDQQAVLDDDGKIITPAVKHTEDRYPKHTVKQWVAELNKSITVNRTSSGSDTPVSKRSITVRKINDDDTISRIGNFRTAKEACQFLKLPLNGDSGNRVLQRAGYDLKPYQGSEFIVPEQ